MAEDYGDEAARELLGWAARIGIDAARSMGAGAGQRSTQEALGRLERSVEGMRAALADGSCRTESPRYAKLDITDVLGLPDPEGAERAVRGALDALGVDNGVYEDEAGRSHLVFRVSDAPQVERALERLRSGMGQATERAAEAAREAGRGADEPDRGADIPSRDAEPLAERATRAREASRSMSAEERAPERSHARDDHMEENRSR